MEYRTIAPSEEKAIKELWSYCFEPEGHPFFEWYFGTYYDKKNVIAGFEGRSLVCCLHLNPYQIYLRGRSFATSYIVGVATTPEGRSQKSIAGLLTASLAEMRQRGQTVVILMPFKGAFYYPYDFEFCYHSLQYDLALEDLRFTTAGSGEMVRLAEEDIPKLQTVYEAFVVDLHGYVLRSRQSWQHLWSEHQADQGHAYLALEQGKPVGYIFYTLKEGVLLVKEMAYANESAKEMLLRFCYNHRSQVARIQWLAPVDDGTLFVLPDPKTGVALYPFMTARMVDVPAALEQAIYPVTAALTVSLAVTDPLAPWNDGCFILKVQDGHGQVARASADQDACHLSSGTLAQLFFGRLSAKKLSKMGKLSAPSQVIERLDKLFPTCMNYINEYY